MAGSTKGPLLLERGSLEDDLWFEKPFDRWRARLDIVAAAAEDDRVVRAAGRDVRLRRGEILAAGSFLSSRWGWSEGKVRVFVSRLLEEGFLERVRRTAVGIVYAVSEFESHQLPSEREAPARATEKKQAPPSPGAPPDQEKGEAARAAWEEKVVTYYAWALPPIPAELRSDEFMEAWRARLIERAEKQSKGKLSYTQVRTQFAKMLKLRALHGMESVVEALERATGGGYAGVVFKEDLAEPRSRSNNPPQQVLFQPEETGADPRRRRKVVV